MVFNSYIFILAFLPVALAGYFLAGRSGRTLPPLFFISLVSLFFYGYWNVQYVPLIVGSILANYAIGGRIIADPARKLWLVAGIIGNVGLLCYYKYSNFFVDNFNVVAGTNYHLEKIILPLGISFFTFQQVGYLIDAANGSVRDRGLAVYFSYVVFFPQFIAGPIVRYTDVNRQFNDPGKFKPLADNLCAGSYLFILGLAKKVLLADNIETYATPLFAAAGSGQGVYLLDSWMAAIAYSLQLYFDFSGYSDMAVGLALMFNIEIPVNFMSPYKSSSFVEFWKRWHMSLSVCFQKYLFTPLALSMRHWKSKMLAQYLPFILTMTIVGFWHGAGWTFVLWGLCHGIFLAVNHAWRSTRRGRKAGGRWTMAYSVILTLTCVFAVNVLFRAESLAAATNLYKGMLGLNGVVLPKFLEPYLPSVLTQHVTLSYFPMPALHDKSLPVALLLLVAGLFIAFVPRNSNEMLKTFKPSLSNLAYAGLLLTACLLQMNRVSVFLYYQF